MHLGTILLHHHEREKTNNKANQRKSKSRCMGLAGDEPGKQKQASQ